ncbi:MAG TPA: alpha-galactosidase [Verrucomicrobiae bacterium]|jgi:alpha-galactosidase|nr:alpha-galactosidase [Verrucomicrobiae bacterium]
MRHTSFIIIAALFAQAALCQSINETVTVPKAGLYPVTVNVTVGDDRSFRVNVNDEAIPRWFTFYNTGGRDRTGSRTFLAPLRAGSNTIRFDNPHEPGPDSLDNIVVAPEPVESFRIAGAVSAPGVEVDLSGDLDRVTFADSHGNYEFPFLHQGHYYVSPARAEMGFSPYARECNSLTNNLEHQNFSRLPPDSGSPVVVNHSHWRLEYSPRGLATIWRDGAIVLSNVYSEIRLPESITSMDFTSHKAKETGDQFIVESSGGPDVSMLQTFSLYPDYILFKVKVSAHHRISSNYIAPLVTHAPLSGYDRRLWVPFDNDKWVRYNAEPFNVYSVSHELSAFYNSKTDAGLVVGSIEHDTWKTGVKSSTSGICMLNGYTSVGTRDTLPHGKVSGETITSSETFLGSFDNFQVGLETYAQATTKLTPPAPWTNGVPFGWNSWGKLQFHINYQKAIKVSDFFATELQPNHFQDDGIVYIGLDSGWDHFTDEQLKNFVDHCQSNHQRAGIYCGPFAQWGGNDGPFLLANGHPQRVDGGTALDPTDPRTRKRLRNWIEKFKRLGFTYLKIDFLVHGSLEADHYYDPSVTTGMQAFNSGMKYLRQIAGDGMYLDEAISPLFPGCYAQSRRVACDSFGAIDQTEYTLNALTYGWWLNKVYDFLDPDHMVLQGFDEGENRARVTSAVITGLMISGDDFSSEGERAKKFLTNEAVDQIARQRKSLHPVGAGTGSGAANVFAGWSGKDFCVAVFNYSSSPAAFSVDLRKAGWPGDGPVTARELWSASTTNVDKTLSVHLAPADAALYRLEKAR